MDFNEKTEAVLAEGAAKRGEYDPEPGSVPYRLYQDYVKRGGYVPPRENFCHFWRVVVLWAPLMWLRDKTVNTDGFKSFMKTRVGGAFRLVGRVISYPFRKIDAAMEAGIDAASDRWGRQKVENFGFGVLFSLIGAMILTFLVAFGVSTFWWAPLLFLAGIGGLVGLIWAASFYLEKKDKEKDARRAAAWDAYFADEGPRPGTKVRKEPGKVKRFFIGVKDFLILTAQVIRVKKWKICPLVNIEPQA